MPALGNISQWCKPTCLLPHFLLPLSTHYFKLQGLIHARGCLCIQLWPHFLFLPTLFSNLNFSLLYSLQQHYLPHRKPLLWNHPLWLKKIKSQILGGADIYLSSLLFHLPPAESSQQIDFRDNCYNNRNNCS